MTPEADVLAQMRAADSRRVDQLVEDVGAVKGGVNELRTGVNELRSAMAVLVKHEVLVEQNAQVSSEIRAEVSAIEVRVHTIEIAMPQLKEARDWVVRAMLAVIGVVALAVIALAVKTGGS